MKRTKVRNQSKIDVAMQAVKRACLLYECDVLFPNTLYNNKCVVNSETPIAKWRVERIRIMH